MKKKVITAILVVSLTLMTGIVSLAADRETSATLDGVALSSPALVDGTAVWLPFRAVCEALGYTVTWSSDGGVITVSAVRNGDEVKIDVTHKAITQNGHLFSTGVLSGNGVRLLNGRTFVDSGLLSSVFHVSASAQAPGSPVALLRKFPNNVTIRTETVTASSDYLKTAVQYPQLQGLGDQAAQDTINKALKQTATKAVSEGQTNADLMAQAIRDGYTGAVGSCETVFDYIVTYNQNGLFSVVLSDYQYSGGAHGTTVQTGFTFDLASGKTLRLGDILDGKAAPTAFIDSAVRKEIDRRAAVGALDEFSFAPFKTVGADPEYYLSNRGIVIYFQQYTYFPYAAGIQEFEISYASLAQILEGGFRFLADTPVLLRPDVQNTLQAGDIGCVKLEGNPTTGYAWHYSISDSSVLSLVSSDYTSPSRPGLVGAGGTYTWNFKAFKTGNAAITFKYYRDWEGESSATADNVRVYNIVVASS